MRRCSSSGRAKATDEIAMTHAERGVAERTRAKPMLMATLERLRECAAEWLDSQRAQITSNITSQGRSNAQVRQATCGGPRRRQARCAARSVAFLGREA